MQSSRRARRMQRHHKRAGQTAELSLTSLMDIFTILVFFLLVNQSEVQDIPNTKSVRLPESTADSKPRPSVSVVISKDEVLVQGTRVAGLTDVDRAETDGIPAITQAIKQATAELPSEAAADAEKREITILGDKEIPYKILKRIIVSSTEANYIHVSLAVVQKEKK